MRAKKLFAKVLFSIGVMALTLVMAEFSVRVLQSYDVMTRYDIKTLYPKSPHSCKLHPSDNEVLVAEYDPKDPQINSYGMRDIEHQHAKPTGTYRIAVLGDSVTFGLGVPRKDIYPRVLQSLLNNATSGLPKEQRYEVLSFGVSGYGTEQELEIYRTKAHKFDPDLIVIGYVLNDMVGPDVMFEAVKQGTGRRQTVNRLGRWSQICAGLWYHYDAYVRMQKRRERYQEAYGSKFAESGPCRAFAEFSKISTETETPILLVIFPQLEKFDNYLYHDVHQTLRHEGKRNGFQVLDLYDAYSKHSATLLQRCPSDIGHPNVRGHRIAAERICDHLRTTRLTARAAGVVKR